MSRPCGPQIALSATTGVADAREPSSDREPWLDAVREFLQQNGAQTATMAEEDTTE